MPLFSAGTSSFHHLRPAVLLTFFHSTNIFCSFIQSALKDVPEFLHTAVFTSLPIILVNSSFSLACLNIISHRSTPVLSLSLRLVFLLPESAPNNSLTTQIRLLYPHTYQYIISHRALVHPFIFMSGKVFHIDQSAPYTQLLQ